VRDESGRVSVETEFKIIFFACLVVAVILHEISHGAAALMFGDDTAKRAGRLTLNPIAHVDPFGSIILPAMAAIGGFPGLGYAKPVPVNPVRLRKPRHHMLFVSLAGPGCNFVLMTVGVIGALMLQPAIPGYPESGIGFRIFFGFALVNFYLGLFNLLPIPPLDGASLIERFIPAKHLQVWWKFRPYGFLVLFLLLFRTDIFATIADPFLEPLVDFMLGR
jgi:Zn-dependent protease